MDGVIAGSTVTCYYSCGCGAMLVVVLASPCMGRPMEKSGVEKGLVVEEVVALLS